MARAKKCEICGDLFECGLDDGDCWCGSVSVSEEKLKLLSKLARDCVCERCLTGERR
ncbi:MAG: cysteine-rich CWC family protein [Thaumarchaeota archaeon]|nr:cysteine-rich CWC family protein [Candidatus Calditenuaceae archaeon]MDW8187068.1 cysteine-rich CWC family protein [Nitrososphaerota archaeon]